MGRKAQAARWPGGKIPASLGRTALTMQQEILINYTPQETRVAVVENGAVQELHVERALERGQVGDIYLGKVVRVLPGMQSAFIDIGAQRTAFLHVADVWQPPAAGEAPAAQRSACHSGEKTARGQKEATDGSSAFQASSATGGSMPGAPTQVSRSSASAGPSTSTQSGR